MTAVFLNLSAHESADDNAIETEKYDPSLPLAFKIARLFKRPIKEIFKAEV